MANQILNSEEIDQVWRELIAEHRASLKPCDCDQELCGICNVRYCDHQDCRCAALGMR